MASASMADISIKGDAYLQYADNGISVSGSDTKNSKRVKYLIKFNFAIEANRKKIRDEKKPQSQIRLGFLKC
jgi:hypothetical protein